jgi:inner membrane protein
MALVAGLVVASHGLLDTLTDGGLGAALLWPFSNQRFFAPWRPIPVAPIGARLLTADGLELMLRECVLFLPLFAAGFWPRRTRD